MIRRKDYPYAVFAVCWLLMVVLLIVSVIWSKVFASPSMADEVARQHGIEPALLKAVCETESSWRPHVTGDGGESIGLCQIKPETALRMFPKHWHADKPQHERLAAMRRLLFKPDANLKIAAIYLKYLIAKYDGNVTLAIAAYNAGENHNAVIHTRKVLRRMNEE